MILLTALLAGQVGIFPPECVQRRRDDARPFTLCVAETAHTEVEQRLQRQLKITLDHVRATNGAAAVSRIRSAQQRWERQRNRSCATETRDAPVSQQALNELDCLTEAAKPRTARLRAIVTGS